MLTEVQPRVVYTNTTASTGPIAFKHENIKLSTRADSRWWDISYLQPHKIWRYPRKNRQSTPFHLLSMILR